MKRLAVVVTSLVLAGTAAAATAQDVVRLPRPSFPPPARALDGPGPRLELVSSRYHSPADLAPDRPAPPARAPRRFRGAELELAIRQPPGRVFLVYGGRYLVKLGQDGYALDLGSFRRPPNGAWLEDLTWAREADGVVYVEHTHLTYARETRGRNAYVSAIDVARKRTLWRSRALVANARTFVIAGELIVSGYGFTAEPDFVYLLDRRTGKVLDRLAVPSAPELIRLRGDRLHVRCYDADVVARIVR